MSKENLMLLKDLGSFFVGGNNFQIQNKPLYEAAFVKGGPTRTVDPNGDFETGQMYVQYYELAEAKCQYPLLLWHGGGVTGACWEDTPDGRSGWLKLFLQSGYDTYLSDAVERGRAGWSRFPDIYESEPVFRSKQEAWINFRIGERYSSEPAERIAIKNTQFPCEKFDVFMKQNVPRWTSNNAAIMAAYEAYIQRVGECVLVVHSQASEFAGNIAQQYPEYVKALVVLEGSAVPSCYNPLSDVPTLYVWGDNIRAGTLWDKYRSNVYAFFKQQQAADKKVEWLDLTELGIKGNSHFLMLDKNSEVVFKLVEEWLHKTLQL